MHLNYCKLLICIEGKKASTLCKFTKLARDAYNSLSDEQRVQLSHQANDHEERMTKTEVLRKGKDIFAKIGKMVIILKTCLLMIVIDLSQ